MKTFRKYMQKYLKENKIKCTDVNSKKISATKEPFKINSNIKFIKPITIIDALIISQINEDEI